MTVALFGHRDTDPRITQVLESTLLQLIEKDMSLTFLIGHHGQLDQTALHTIHKLQKKFPSISCTIVLSHIPKKPFDDQTIYPERVAQAPPRLSIIERNRWMINHADLVILYLRYSPSNITYCKQYAEQKRKAILLL